MPERVPVARGQQATADSNRQYNDRRTPVWPYNLSRDYDSKHDTKNGATAKPKPSFKPIRSSCVRHLITSGSSMPLPGHPPDSTANGHFLTCLASDDFLELFGRVSSASDR